MSTLGEQLDELGNAVGEVEALAALAVQSYDHGDWSGSDPVQVERMAFVVGAVSKAATTAVTVFNRVHTAIVDARPAEPGAGGDQW